MSKKLLSAIIWVIVFQIIGYLLGKITQTNILDWYHLLHKSSLTPPPLVFAIVWPILYTMIALSGWLLWQQRQQKTAKIALGFYGTQVAMNWAWTPLFFHFHLIGLSFIWIILIAIITLITIYLTKNKFRISSLLLIPYFVWLVFAAYLNGAIWILN